MKPVCYLMLLFSAFLICSAAGQQSPKHANEIVKEACTQAAIENKNVFIIFHASWCGWCHKMDRAMNDASCKDLFSNNYVIRHIAVNEAEDKKHLENPGGQELLKKYHGEKQGIPYWLIFDKNANLLADSQKRPEGAGFETPGQNTGCPATKDEVASFIHVLQKTSSLDPNQLATIAQRFIAEN